MKEEAGWCSRGSSSSAFLRFCDPEPRLRELSTGSTAIKASMIMTPLNSAKSQLALSIYTTVNMATCFNHGAMVFKRTKTKRFWNRLNLGGNRKTWILKIVSRTAWSFTVESSSLFSHGRIRLTWILTFYGFPLNSWQAQAVISGAPVPSVGSSWLNLAYLVVRYGDDTEVWWMTFIFLHLCLCPTSRN